MAWLARDAGNEIIPTVWAGKLEEALGKADLLKSILVQFDEKKLTCVSAQLRYETAYQSLNACYRPLANAISAAVCCSIKIVVYLLISDRHQSCSGHAERTVFVCARGQEKFCPF